ncbi:DENN domain-containing protein 5B-like [Oopsacas minuta]|uniref:DENN domain-containing protein 5B-like n=1 Tax=Oopsacas minuta TaxID=111878 RepID=A0AAV7KKI4_9METZ|nr:DENN domain-containing protein 5B-like [Oopsacas minuta]
MLPALDTKKKRFKSKYAMSRSFSYSIPSSPHRELDTRRGSVGTATNPLITEVQHILDQDCIMTDIGRVRMWIKLLLEKQSLSTRVKELLSLTTYINTNYHKSSFIRTNTELEQLLYHLDSLSCVEFSCFTHDFPQSELNYSATLSIARTVLKHTSVLWLVVSGTLGRTDVIKLPKVGHDNGGLNPDVFINNIKITNNLTGNLYVIEANRNLSEKQKDESVEYYFAARKYLTQQNSLNIRFEGTSDSDSPSECIKTRLQDSIRDVIHYFTEPRLAVQSLTYLVLGENRLIPLLVEMLLYELNCTKNPFTQLWTYFSHILVDMKFSLSQSVNKSSSQNRFITTFSKLEDYNNRSGPIEKIYVFLMTSLSHQILHEWIGVMSESTYTTLYYKNNAFLLNFELKEFMYGAVVR